MFSYLRYFAIISLILVVVGAVALSTYFQQIKRNELLNTTLSHTHSAVVSFSDTIWQRFRSTPAADISTLTGEAQRFFKPMSYIKVTIVSPDISSLYYGSTNAVVTTNGTERVTLYALDQVQRGQPVARILDNVYITGGPDPNTPRMLAQLILPLMAQDFSPTDQVACASTTNNSAKCKPQAIAEIYVDVTQEWAAVRLMQYIIFGTMVGLFFVLVGVLLFSSWRAEAIIARQHEVNLELIATAAAAEAQSRDKSQFLASVSHELRTPLNAIIGFSEILREETRALLEKTHQAYVEDICASGKHLLSLINDILDYSKAEAGKLQIEWAETDATKTIRNSLRMVLPRAETAQVTLVEDIPNHHLVVVTDAKKLKQVLLNLLSNAVKFTPAGGAVRCHAWEDVVTQSLVIQVRDTGIGIAPKDISKVMTPFGQVDSALSRRYEGTGLGLPLSKKFVEAMGGTFSIESELNVGTTVTFSIPKQPKNWMGATGSTADAASAGADDVASGNSAA